MNSSPAPPARAPLWPEPWAMQASVEADRVQNRLKAVTAGRLSLSDAAYKAAVESHVTQADEACRRGRRRKRRGWRDRWRGTSVERAYLHLHAAKVFLVDLLPDAEFEALVPEVKTRLAMVLDRNDPRRMEAEGLLRVTAGRPRRAVVRQALETAYDASDEKYARLRDFRNIILLAAASVTLLTGVLLTVVALSPHAIPMCFEPGVTTAAVGQQQVPQITTVCPSGDRQRPTGGDILIVAGLGAIGGALGAIVAIRNLRGTSTPYSVSTALAILKGPTGALTAVIGMLLLAGGFVPGLSNLDSQRQILAYALIFGIAQQLVTRVADNRAQQILDKLPSKDPQAQQAQPSVSPPEAPPGLPDGLGVQQSPPDGGAHDGKAPPSVPPSGMLEAPETGASPPSPDGTEANGKAHQGELPASSPVGTAILEPDAPQQAATQATDDYLAAGEVEQLTGEKYPLEPEGADEFPPDEGEPDVNDDEAGQTGADAGRR